MSTRIGPDRGWLLGGVLTAVLVVVMAWFTVIGPTVSTTGELNDQAVDAQGQNVAQQARVAGLRNDYNGLATLKVELNRVREQLPVGSGLPDGLSIDPTSARITGTPTTSTIPITWTITNLALSFNPPQGLTTPKVNCDGHRCTAFYSGPVNLESLTEGGDRQYGYSVSVEHGTLQPNPTRTSLRIHSSSQTAGERVTLHVRVTDGTGAVVNSQIGWTTR